MKGRLSARGEAGFGLIEVMVSAVVIVLVATATVTSIGASQKQSGSTLARGVTANLAEQDQERMKAMSTDDLIGYAATRPVVQGNGTYTVQSDARLVQGPGSDEVTCTSTGDASQFVRLTTTVTPPAATKGRPQKIVSLESLPITEYSPTAGTLIVKLTKADGTTGQPSIPVSLAGPDSRSGVTNADGCAIFEFLTPGSYVATLNTAGYVDETLSQRRDLSVTVNPAKISSTPTQRYDRAGALSPVRFNGNATGTASGITISNGGIPNPSTRTFDVAATTSATGLFPFATSAYKAWAGRCALNNPEVWEPAFYTTNAAAYGPVMVSAGLNAPANVREPNVRINMTVRGRSQTFDASSARLFVRQIDTGCNNSQQFYGDGTTTSPQLSVAGMTSATVGTSANQDIALTQFNRAFPYGRYWVCAQITKTGSSGTGSANSLFSAVATPPASPTPAAVYNTTFAGQTTTTPQAVTVDATSSANNVGCVSGSNPRWGSSGPTALAAP